MSRGEKINTNEDYNVPEAMMRRTFRKEKNIGKTKKTINLKKYINENWTENLRRIEHWY